MLNRTIEILVNNAIKHKWVKHHIYPFIIRSKKERYSPKHFFDSFYNSGFPEDFTDRITLSPSCPPWRARFHYNCVENSIIEFLWNRTELTKGMEVLDVGSGTGHWIDFYRDVYSAKHIVGVEISDTASDYLKTKYSADDRVEIVTDDVSSKNFSLDRQFSIINAIGVMFHIVDDALWEQCVGNLAEHLAPAGIIMVGGQFGRLTRDVQFHAEDNYDDHRKLRKFGTLEDLQAGVPESVLVNKRIRSFGRWKEASHKHGLTVIGRTKSYQNRAYNTPENNLLVLTQK